MDIAEYSKKVENNRANLPTQLHDIVHMIFGLITELGELTDTYKKYLAYGREVDLVNVKEELGDIMWYFIGMCNILGFDFWDVLETNVRKLDKRYKNGFTKEEAENRNLEVERKVLETKAHIEIISSEEAEEFSK